MCGIRGNKKQKQTNFKPYQTMPYMIKMAYKRFMQVLG